MKEEAFTWRELAKKLSFFLGDQKYPYIFWSFLVFIGESQTIISPIIIALIIDFFTTYSTGDSITPLYTYIGTLTLTILVTTIIHIYARKKSSEIQFKTIHDIRTKGFKNLINFSLSWHGDEGSGNKIQKIDKCAEATGSLLYVITHTVLSLIMVLLGTFGVFLVLNRSLFVFFIIYAIIFILIERYYNKRIYELNHGANIALEKASGVYYESTSNIMSIKSLGMKNPILSGVKSKEEVAREKRTLLTNMNYDKNQKFRILNAFAIGVFFLLLIKDVLAGVVTVGFVATYYLYYRTINFSMWQINAITPRLIEIKSQISRALPIFFHKEDKYFGNKRWDKQWKKISFEHVCFSYKNNTDLHDVSLDINKNEKIGIVGASGSGKSTISKILLGLYKINKGSIKIDNRNFYEISHEKILEDIAPVMQETELFNLSIKDNITMLRNIEPSLVQKAIKIAQLEPIIEKLPDGLNTIIGEKGYKLSGGERQRIGIARAICKNTNFIILDEATSALDSRTEELIEKGLESLQNKTLVIIAHRLSTLKNVDKILVFDRGKIIEKGDYKKLLRDKKSVFYKLWQRQNLKK